VTTWSIGRLLAVDAEALSACLMVGSIIAWSGATSRGRTGGMVALLLWSVIIPAVSADRGVSAPLLDGPFVRAWIEAGLGPGPLTVHGWWPAAITAGVAIAIWLVAATRRPPTAGEPTMTSVS
jgi:hypothetical protein